jgi:heme/copper-type cytochrome/quinol oxidase subunit 3
MLSNLSGMKSPGWWGMMCLVATEAMLFASFFAAYLYLHGPMIAVGEEGGHYPSVGFMIPMTIVLLASSGSFWWGERGIREGRQMQLRLGLGITFLLGVAFLVLQGFEYHSKTLGPTVSAYHSVVYTTTTFHGAHVAVGLLMNLFVQVRAWLGHFDMERRDAVENAGIYWHFVDTVWICIVLLFYLSPRLW